MGRKLAASGVLAFLAACAGSALLWALQSRMPGPLTWTLSPVCDSPWEMGKAVFFPALLAAPLLWRLRCGSRGGLCLMAIAGAAAALLLTRWTELPPAAVVPLALAAAILLYLLLLRRVIRESLLWYALVIALAVAYILLTIVHPGGVWFLARGDVAAIAPIPF